MTMDDLTERLIPDHVEMKFSTELIRQMGDEWSGPVQIKVYKGHGGWQLVTRHADCCDGS